MRLFLIIELLTTPQLHYIIRSYNDGGAYGQPNENGYFEKLCKAFQTLLQVIRRQWLGKAQTVFL